MRRILVSIQSLVEAGLPEKQGLKLHYPNSLSLVSIWVEAGLPEKQGLKHKF